MKRLFIAINLPEEIKTQITQILTQINTDIRDNPRFNQRESAFRWLPANNWHLTITFLGYQPDDAIPVIVESSKSAAKNYSHILENMRIVFDGISFGPTGKRPRMIWLVGTNETSKNLAVLKNTLEDELVKNGIKFQRENRPYNMHLTLARFNIMKSDVQRKFYQYLGHRTSRDVGCPKIEFTPQSLDLMESYLKRTGAEYEVSAKIPF
jgi:2'-5' RNA ligase